MKRFCKFSLVGLVNTAVDFSVFGLLLSMWNMYPPFANICAFGVAMVNSFILNAIWTFGGFDFRNISRRFLRYALIGIVGLILSTFIVWMLQGSINIYVAKILALAVSMAWNYIGLSVFVFKRES